ncbi:MAG: TIGR04086 family membrane protein [Ruminococcus sp.]|nr:TIGR04086 family membrane protein [Ruminococcus sp.]
MRRHHRSIWTNSGLSIALSAAAGVITSALCMMLFAAFTYYLMDSMAFSDFFGTASLAVGGLTGGYTCGRFRRRKGLAEGIICGAVMYAAIGIIGLAAARELLSIKKLLLLAAFSAAGGVSGVNSKRPKNLRTD